MAKTTAEIVNDGSMSEKLNRLIELIRNVNQLLKRYGVD